MQGWFDSHTWLHYDESKDLLLSVCMKAVGGSKLCGEFITKTYLMK